MAFPSTISTLVSDGGYLNVGGPWVASNGAVYVLTRSPTADQLHMFKASDPSSSWTGAGTDFSVPSNNGIRQLAACQVGDNIHIVTRDCDVVTNNQLRYHVFSMAADGYTVTNELIHDTYESQDADPADTIVDICVRSNGDVIVLYEGPTVTTDIKRGRTYYARRISGTWSADIALDAGGNAHWYPGGLVLGVNDNVHFFFHDYTNNDAYQRTLDSSYNLEAISAGAAFDTQILPSPDALAQRGCAYSASAGGTFVRYPYYNSFNPDINDVKFSSSATPTAAVATNITGATTIGGFTRHCISEAADGSIAYAVFIDTANDLYLMSNSDDAGWSAATLIQAASSATEVFSNIYTRNSAKVIGIVYQDVTDVKYTEYTLSSVAVSSSPSLVFGRLMMGMGR